jgi:hypothetical protein
MSKYSRNLVTQLSVLWAFSLAGLALVASLALPILAEAPAGASAAPGTTVSEEINVTITRAPTTATATATTTAPPATTTQTTNPTVLATAPRTAAATSIPPPFAFTGGPILAELELAVVLLVAGGAMLGGLRLFSRGGA